MKIRKESTDNTISFEDVSTGTVFKDEQGCIYMKLASCYKFSPEDLGTQYNVVFLKNGSLVYFNDPKEKVEVLENAVLTY